MLFHFSLSVSETKRLVVLSSIMLAGWVDGWVYLLALASRPSSFCLSVFAISPSVSVVAKGISPPDDCTHSVPFQV